MPGRTRGRQQRRARGRAGRCLGPAAGPGLLTAPRGMAGAGRGRQGACLTASLPGLTVSLEGWAGGGGGGGRSSHRGESIGLARAELGENWLLKGDDALAC